MNLRRTSAYDNRKQIHEREIMELKRVSLRMDGDKISMSTFVFARLSYGFMQLNDKHVMGMYGQSYDGDGSFGVNCLIFIVQCM